MTDLLAENEIEEIRDHVGRFFEPRLVDVDSRLVVDRALHETMGRLGFFSQGLPSGLGGLGLPAYTGSLIAEAAGRALIHGPWLDQLAVLELLVPTSPSLVHELANGTTLTSVTFTHDRLDWGTASETLSGEVRGIRFGELVDYWCLITPTRWAIVRSLGGDAVKPVRSIDAAWSSIDAQFDRATVLCSGELDVDAYSRVLSRVNSLVASFSVGAAIRVLEISSQYAQDRHQFGQPIGSFQAIKHKLANCHIDLVHARAMSACAARTGGSDDAAVARVLADETLRRTAETAVQVHGGLGFTTAVPVHHYLKAAQHLRAWPRPIFEELGYLRDRLALDRPTTAPVTP